MARELQYVLELLGIVGIIGLIAYISWTKMALGAVLGILGAYFPQLRDRKDIGEAVLWWRRAGVRFIGGLRFCVVLAGIILIIGAVLDGHTGFTAAKEEAREKQEAARNQAELEQLKGIRDRLQTSKDISPEAKKSLDSLIDNASSKRLHRLDELRPRSGSSPN